MVAKGLKKARQPAVLSIGGDFYFYYYGLLFIITNRSQ
jgi:hypothetical protein